MIDDREAELGALLKEVRRIEVQSRRLATGLMAGSYSSVFRGAGVEFEEVREYVDGDDPRSVDWNVTARTGRPHIKKFVEERELTLLFLVDLSASMSGGWGIHSARQMAARVAACLSLSAVKSNDKVGLIAFSDRVESFIAPKKGLPHALRIVRDTLALPASGATTDLRPALDLLRRAERRRIVVFLMSDFETSGYGDALFLAARRHDLIAVRLIAPEFDPGSRALVRLRDPETGRLSVFDLAHAGVRAALAERIRRFKSSTEEILRNAGVDRIDVMIPRTHDKDAVVRPLLRFFRMRELRRVGR